MKSFIYINKNSGNGYAETYFKKYLNKFVNENFSEVVINHLPCDYINYNISNDDNNENNCLFIVGGDGSVSITIENIMKYSNIEDLKIPIYICPFGSGNGLAKNLNINPFNLRLDGGKIYIYPMEIQTNNSKEYKYLSFLSQTWSIISDIDINTEFLRYIGEFRFYYGILKNILMPNYYKGILELKNNNKKNKIEGEFLLFCASNAPWITSDFKVATKSDIFKNEIDLLIIRKKLFFYERIQLIYYLIQEKIHELDFIEYYKIDEYNLELIDDNSKIVRDGEIINSNKISVKKSNKKFLFYIF